MKHQLNPGIHFIIYILFASIFFLGIIIFVTNDNIILSSVGLFFIITGVWGNKAGMVLLKIPSGPKSYKVINYVLVVMGVFCIIYGVYAYTNSLIL